jgi:CheY-like chemotaxis protein
MSASLSEAVPYHKTRGAVLLVEDDPCLQDAVREVLEDEGYQVHCAANGEEALALLADIPAPSLLLVDLMMPKMDGFEFLRRVRSTAALAALPAVVISASRRYPNPELNASFLPKPFDLEELLQVVEQHCAAARAPRG